MPIIISSNIRRSALPLGLPRINIYELGKLHAIGLPLGKPRIRKDFYNELIFANYANCTNKKIIELLSYS